MPHATEINGDKSSSQFISHLASLPAVSDGIETFKSNQYGRKSLDLLDDAYNRFGKPVQPYLETPYAYAKPYAVKADELADNGLTTVEKHFPIVKENTNTIIDTAKGYAFWPVTYLTDTWQHEYSRATKYNDRGPGLTTSVIAIVSTELHIAADFFHAVADFLGPKYEESKKKGADYVSQIKDTASHYTQVGKEKAGEAQKVGEEKADEAKKEAGKAKDDVQKKANDVKADAQKKTSK